MATLETLKTRLRRLGEAAALAEQHAQDARDARDAAIEAAELERVSVRDIAAWTGLSRPRVQAIIVARTAARQARQQGPID